MEAVEKIKNGRFCSVVFAKRSDNSLRELKGRTGVKKYLKGKEGKGAAYSAKEHDLIVFYDVKEAEYKSIPIERILSVNGQTVV